MAHFLLVHGAAHGAWCWRDVIPVLRRLGHSVRAIDLPSHGDDQTPPEEVTLADYAQAIVDAIQQPTVLVGHSMGGYPITLAAELAPENVVGLVYLCAYTPWPGLGLADMRKWAASQPLREAIRISPDRRTMTFDPDLIEAKFYHDCPTGTLEFAQPRLSTQPVAPMETPVKIDRTTALPRSYIICKNDRAIPPEMQHQMATRFDPENVFEIETAHSAFFAKPVELAELLNKIVNKTKGYPGGI